VLPEQFEPLPVELWLCELGRLSDWCEHASGDESDDADERAVRRAFHLAALAPMGIRQVSTPTIGISELDALLASGDLDDACRAVIGAHASVDLVHLPHSDIWIASFSIAGDGPVRCEASNAVRALIRAWATFFTTAAG